MHRKISLYIFLIISLIPCYGDDFSFYADSVISSIAKGDEKTQLLGHAKIVTETLTITADKIEIYGSNYRFANCEGNVYVNDTDKGIKLSSNSMLYDRELDISKVQGQAQMEDLRNELIVKGSYLENRGQEEITIIQVGVRVLKADLICRSEFALYRRQTDQLELSGFPYVESKGDIYEASRIHINLDTEEINLYGDVSGTVNQEEKPEETLDQNQQDKPNEQ
ncbi:LptA/OstA family protein [Spirochaeta cellobiosiphila]|uniref:LptA/OstA family protein n=1 Tax=Spirochaeta cellobiosiphila TaxID=504483 RepID=UPI000419E2AC|nr:LptA/OstA family protein [Spirochaeta cellobiosiphila]